jgi:MoxR-like ATPase
LEGRDYVVPDDLQFLLSHVLAHRLLITAEAHVAGRSAQDLLARILTSTPIPGSNGQR